jgi:hypothetical protein
VVRRFIVVFLPGHAYGGFSPGVSTFPSPGQTSMACRQTPPSHPQLSSKTIKLRARISVVFENQPVVRAGCFGSRQLMLKL